MSEYEPSEDIVSELDKIVDLSGVTDVLKNYEEKNVEENIEANPDKLMSSMGKASGTIRVSKLLNVDPTALPARDFTMPFFEASDIPEELKPYLVSSSRENLRNYEPDINAAYNVCLGLRENMNHLLTGVKGCGKTSLVYWIACELGWPVLNVVGHSQLTPEELYGQVRLVEGKTVFDRGTLTKAVEYGAILLFDEVFQTPSDILISANSVLETGGELTVQSMYDNKVVKRHENCRFIFTSNSRGAGDTTGKYVGEQVTNSALLDRIQLCTAVHYMSVSEQRKVLKNTLTDEDGVCHATEGEMENMIYIMAGVNEAFQGGRLADSMSMRGLLSFAKLACMIGNKGLAFYTVVVNKVDSTEERDVLLSIARTRGGDDYVHMV